MAWTLQQLLLNFKEFGIKQGNSVVVHSSYKSMGNVIGGPRSIIYALREIILPDGALLFPNLNISQEFTVENPPRFDLKNDHLKETVGIIPETFKFEYAKHFSMHTTHSMMGIGEKAPFILKDHEKAGVPCGKGTPWEKNALFEGKILLIGVDQRSNTTYHCAEEQIENSYQLSSNAIDGVVVINGQEIVVRSRLHVWGNHPNFNIINPELEVLGYLKKGRVGNAPTICIEAAGFLQLCLKKLGTNKNYFL